MWCVKRRVSSVEYKVSSAKCRVWGVKYWGVKCRVWGVKYGAWSAKCAAGSEE